MIKYILLLGVVLLSGCAALDFFITPEGEIVVDGGKAVAQGFGLSGVIGASLFSLGIGLYKDYKTKKSKIEMVSKLGADAYHDYKSMNGADKTKLDEAIRNMVPKKYRKYYDSAKL